jgi:L-seryl-tRNA(Ser) seleniumtransferase
MARRKGVVISRSQLVEIGGGFRVPDILKQSGAKLVEVGTTNRTNKDDYEQAINDESKRASLILRAHHSNFRIVGFTSEPTLAELVQVGEKYGLPVVDDIGSGAMLDTADFGLGHEPMVQESLESGADLVCFSGDKLLGGPQAGIIVGRRDLVRKLVRHPLTRALRPDKLCLAALSATLLHYLKDEALQNVPVWQMIAMSLEEIEARASNLANAVGGKVIDGKSMVGGGSLPEETLPTCLVTLSTPAPQRFAARLRRRYIIARVQDNSVLFDLRTVPEEDDQRLASEVREILFEQSQKWNK